MENSTHFSNHPANSQTTAAEHISVAPPIFASRANGQSVDSIPTSSPPFSLPLRESQRGSQSQRGSWFVIRATRGRAQDVYNQLLDLHLPDFEVYIPHYSVEGLQLVDGELQKTTTQKLLHNGILFVRTTRQEFTKLVHAIDPYPFIKGLTPYYDHFRIGETGRNDYLIVPDKQFRDFRTILESRDVNILVDQDKMPSYLNGKQVEITSGPFTGVTGTLLRWKGLRRVFIRLNHLGTYATGFIRTCDFRLIEDD